MTHALPVDNSAATDDGAGHGPAAVTLYVSVSHDTNSSAAHHEKPIVSIEIEGYPHYLEPILVVARDFFAIQRSSSGDMAAAQRRLFAPTGNLELPLGLVPQVIGLPLTILIFFALLTALVVCQTHVWPMILDEKTEGVRASFTNIGVSQASIVNSWSLFAAAINLPLAFGLALFQYPIVSSTDYILLPTLVLITILCFMWVATYTYLISAFFSKKYFGNYIIYFVMPTLLYMTKDLAIQTDMMSSRVWQILLPPHTVLHVCDRLILAHRLRHHAGMAAFINISNTWPVLTALLCAAIGYLFMMSLAVYVNNVSNSSILLVLVVVVSSI